MIKKVLFFLLFSFPLLAGCGGDRTNGPVPVHLNLTFPSSSLSKISAVTPPAVVARVTLEVTGPGMSAISLSQAIPQGSGEVIINLNIPAGTARRFAITAFDGNRNIIFRGESTVDIRLGGSPVVTVDLVSVTPPPPKPKPIPRFAYVANEGSNTVSIYTVNPNGQLRANGYVTAGTGTSTVALSATLDPLGRFVYVVNESTSTSTPGTISSYTINPATGALTNTSVINTDGPFPRDFATIDPSGRFLYVSNAVATSTGTISSYTINPTTGALTNIGVIAANGTNGETISPVFIDPLGRFAYVGGATSTSGQPTTTPFTMFTYTINPTGTLTNNGAVADLGILPSAAALHPSGQFAYVANEGTSSSTPGTISTYNINPTTGALTNIGTVATDGARPADAAIDPSGRFVYIANESNSTSTPNTISTYTINPTTGVLTSIGTPVVAGLGQPAVTVDPSGKFVYVTNAGSNDILTYIIDPSTGALTPTGNIRTQDRPQSIAVTSGPTPVTYTPKFAYAVNSASGTVSAYTIDPSQGILTATSTPIAAGQSPSFITADPTGRFAYVTTSNLSGSNGNVFIYQINAASGALTQVGLPVPAFRSSSIAVDPSGRFAYVVAEPDGNAIITHSIDTLGTLTEVNRFFFSGNTVNSLTLDPTGRFGYAAAFGSITIFRFNSTSGLPSDNVSVVQGGQNLKSGLIDPTGKFAYFIEEDFSSDPTNTIQSFAIDPINGTLLTGTAVTVGPNPIAMAVDPMGRFIYLVDDELGKDNGSISAFKITQSGALEPIGQPVLTGRNPTSITIDTSGKFVYVGNFPDSNGGFLSTYAIALDGVLTLLPSTVPTQIGPISITSTGVIQ